MRKLVLALGVIGVLGIAGCASDKGIDEDGYSTKPLVDRKGEKLKSADAERLYKSGRDFLVHGQPAQALPLYSEVEARFPFSKYAVQSSLETVAAHYQAGDYDQAVDAADHFIKQRPRNANIAYVYYMRGMSNYKRNSPGFLGAPPDKRNVEYLRQSFSDFSIVAKNYPNSVYAADARQHMIDVRNRVAAFELQIAEYYLRRHAYVASSRRAEDIVAHYQGSDSVPRALEIMEESYAHLELPDLAEDTRAILQTSYPNYPLHRREFYRQLAGDQPSYTLPAMDSSATGAQPLPQDSEADSKASSDTSTSSNPRTLPGDTGGVRTQEVVPGE